MKNISKDLTKLSKFQILIAAGIKVLRGVGTKPFLQQSHGILFVGKHVHISNRQLISVDSKVKFEDYSVAVELGRHIFDPCSKFIANLIGLTLEFSQN